jgi:hypothetical protein
LDSPHAPEPEVGPITVGEVKVSIRGAIAGSAVTPVAATIGSGRSVRLDESGSYAADPKVGIRVRVRIATVHVEADHHSDHAAAFMWHSYLARSAVADAEVLTKARRGISANTSCRHPWSDNSHESFDSALRQVACFAHTVN